MHAGDTGLAAVAQDISHIDTLVQCSVYYYLMPRHTGTTRGGEIHADRA